MDTKTEDLWTVRQEPNGMWQVLWPRDMWSPITESTTARKLWDLVFDMNTAPWESVGFYMETDRGPVTHYVSHYVHEQKGSEAMIEHWIRQNAEIWGVCYTNKESAENFHNELNKRYTWYLLKLQD